MQIITANTYLAGGFASLCETLDNNMHLKLRRLSVIDVTRLEALPFLAIDVQRNSKMHITGQDPVLLLTSVPELLGEKRLNQAVVPLSLPVEVLKKRLISAVSPGVNLMTLMHRLKLCFGYEPLTVREVEVADLLASGLCMKQIAYNLRISPKTAYGHGLSLRDKARLTGLTRLSHSVSSYADHRKSRVLHPVSTEKWSQR
ncbi:LuxR C-terminal-related transcriptional regulator [Pantoea sp. M_9]|uniref:LuxR C-terminal-related transcriptional regulator n=1 Tax=Pantoea sp. M_9 TaxID=2608041 RepID=UPI001232CFA5|nr:LuxR C-terminal-related transcriptional regulator [Pantoea sp. M_9]KAA5971620.1 hypothetical protein F3I15_05555 [Pantoea sp. M_9]